METKVIVLFAHWCPKCNMMMPIVDEIEKRYQGQIEFMKIDIEKETELAKEYEIELVPTFIIVRGTKEIGRMCGMIGQDIFIQRLEKMLL